MLIDLQIKEKSFPRKTIFRDTEIRIETGEFVAIKGPSGIGKSTLLKMIGFLESFEGKYFFHDSEISKKSREITRITNFAYLFQNPLLIPFYNVFENVVMPLRNLKQTIDERQVDEVLNELGLVGFKYENVETLSGGEATRVAMARAMMSNRRIIIADEPTGNLDYDNALAVMKILKSENQRGKTIILVTHSNEFSEFYSRTIRLENYKIIG